jgi:alkylated DNA repair protein alkB family protein 1
MPSPLDINSQAYKKALRLHKKSKKTPAAQDIPALREQEKEYKAKFPPPSLSDVLDLSWNSESHGDAWKGSATVDGLRMIPCKRAEVKAYAIESIPGMSLIHHIVAPVFVFDTSCTRVCLAARVPFN